MSKRCRLNWNSELGMYHSLQQIYIFLCTEALYACLAVNLTRQLILSRKSGLPPQLPQILN